MVRISQVDKNEIWAYDTEAQRGVAVILVKHKTSHQQMIEQGYTAFFWEDQIFYTKENLANFNVTEPSLVQISQQDFNPYASYGFFIKTNNNYGWVEPFCDFVKNRANKFLLKKEAVEKFHLASEGRSYPVYLLQGSSVIMDNLVCIDCHR